LRKVEPRGHFQEARGEAAAQGRPAAAPRHAQEPDRGGIVFVDGPQPPGAAEDPARGLVGQQSSKLRIVRIGGEREAAIGPIASGDGADARESRPGLACRKSPDQAPVASRGDQRLHAIVDGGFEPGAAEECVAGIGARGGIVDQRGQAAPKLDAHAIGTDRVLPHLFSHPLEKQGAALWPKCYHPVSRD
jgi:hypothetical protein